MKFGQLVEYNKINIFFKNYAENEAMWIVPDPFYFLKKLNIRLNQFQLN